MKVELTAPKSLAVELADEDELRREERANLAVGGLLLRPAPVLAPFTAVEVTLRLAGRGTAVLAATVVGAPPGALALQLTGGAEAAAAAVAALLATPAHESVASAEDEAPGEGAAVEGREGTLWDRLRALTPPQKILLAPKADRMTRALLLQEGDPMVLFSLLKNPRLTIDEVVRIAKSSFLNFQAAETILKTSPWAANLDVRLALVWNPKLPLPLGLRILPTLPETEVRAVARNATSMPLKQAALRRIHGGG